MPDLEHRRMQTADVRLLYERAGVEIRPTRMPIPAIVPPPIGGRWVVHVSADLPSAARTFVLLHELVHVAAGHADELAWLELDETRYPIEDRIADAVAAIAITTPAEREMPADVLCGVLRSAVPLTSRAWAVHRSQDVALFLSSRAAE